MSIVSIRKGYSGHAAGGKVDSKTTVDRFSIITDDVNDTAIFSWPQTDPIDCTTVIPTPGTFYPGTSDRRSKEPQVKIISPTFFNVEVHYGTNVTESGEEKEEGEEDKWAANPFAMPARESGRTLVTNTEMFMDVNGVPFVNRFGEPFTGLTQDFSDQSLTITRNEAAFDFGIANKWFKTICSGVFRDEAEGRVLMNDISWEDVKDEVQNSLTFGDVLYTKVTYEILFRMLDIPLENTSELTKKGENLVWKTITANAASASKYAWYYRYVYTGKHHKDSNGLKVAFSDGQDHNLRIADNTLVLDEELPDFVLQQRYKVLNWQGLV